MRVRFTHDYQGKGTGPHFYKAGDEAEVEAADAQWLIDRQHAEAVEVEVAPEPEEVEKPKRARKAK